jgi:hypothetical protein
MIADDERLIGLKIVLLAFLAMAGGYILSILGVNVIGAIVMYSAFAVAMFGFILHAYIVLKGLGEGRRRK